MTRDEIIARHPIVEFVSSRGHELKQAGANFVTNGCPMTQHRRGHRPVTIDVAKRVWHCNDCKRGGSVIDWLAHEKFGGDAKEALRHLDGSADKPATRSSTLGRIVKTYDYTDENGKLLFQCCRYKPKDFRQRRPDPKQPGRWLWNLGDGRRVLYRLPEVIKAQTVCFAEGEKDCDNLRALGFTATTNPLGAGKWRDEYSETLRGKDVIVFGDVGDSNGDGEKHTAQVIASLSGKANSVRHAVVPDGFKDISAYIETLKAESALSGESLQQSVASLIEQAESPTGTITSVQEAEELLPPPPAPYEPPPLDLLPSVLQDYVRAAAESINVDHAFILLPMLSCIATAIGSSRSIRLKHGFIQPSVVWTGIIARSGGRKSPSEQEGCFPILAHERELMRQNQEAAEIYAEQLAQWESKKGKQHGDKPDKPAFLTSTCDDLTIEVLADILVSNPRGILVHKDELSHWLASFDQYKNARGSDVSRWLSLHTAVALAVDRRTDHRHYRILNPRVNIAGGIQPKILRRTLTPEFFERGLPARFIFAYPPFRQDKWSEATVSDELRARVLELFSELWLLQPNDGNPQLLGLDRDAKAVFVKFYNECGLSALEASEHQEAAWSKLTGYGARFALIGQLAHNPHAKSVTGAIMEAACNFARWSGNESVRIYDALAETQAQRDRRELVEFIQSRGGAVSVRDVITYYWPLKNQSEETEWRLNALVRSGFGNWHDSRPPGRGRPTRVFQLISSSASAQFRDSRREITNSADADVQSDRDIASPADGAENNEVVI
jgi:hypothetical protein